MQTVSASALNALTGSYAPYVKVDVWRGGQLVAQDLPVTDGSVEVSDDGKAIRQRLSLTVADPDGSLTPRSESAALAPYGSMVNVRAGVQLGGQPETCCLGSFRIETVDAGQEWRTYSRVDGVRWSASGGKISITGVDLAAVIQDAKFLAPEQPPGGFIRAEVIRLCTDLVGVAAWPGVPDVAIPATVTYTDDRWAAICDLAAALDAIPYMDPYGYLGFRPAAPGASVWTVTSGSEGVLISAPTKLTRQGIYNAVVSSGTSAGQVPVSQIRLETGGELAWGGPFGRVPYLHDSPLITTEAAADADALTTLARLVGRRSFAISVECACNYWLEVGDTVTLELPLGTVDGRITDLSWPLTPGAMSMTVTVPRALFWVAWGRRAP